MIVSCRRCGKLFNVKPSHKKSGEGKYCSRACSDAGRRRGRVINCANCQNPFYATRKQMRLSKSRLNFCKRSCYFNFQTGQNHPRWKYGENAYLPLMKKKREQICNRCGIQHTRVLIVHHIDKNRKNNVLSNLVWLCRNCHHLVHKYREPW